MNPSEDVIEAAEQCVDRHEKITLIRSAVKGTIGLAITISVSMFAMLSVGVALQVWNWPPVPRELVTGLVGMLLLFGFSALTLRDHVDQPMRERLVQLYLAALETGDWYTVEQIFIKAQDDPELDRMLDETNDALVEDDKRGEQ